MRIDLHGATGLKNIILSKYDVIKYEIKVAIPHFMMIIQVTYIYICISGYRVVNARNTTRRSLLSNAFSNLLSVVMINQGQGHDHSNGIFLNKGCSHKLLAIHRSKIRRLWCKRVSWCGQAQVIAQTKKCLLSI